MASNFLLVALFFFFHRCCGVIIRPTFPSIKFVFMLRNVFFTIRYVVSTYLGREYESEHEDEIKDRRQYGVDGYVPSYVHL